MMLETTWMAPLRVGVGSIDSARDLINCRPPTRERVLVS